MRGFIATIAILGLAGLASGVQAQVLFDSTQNPFEDANSIETFGPLGASFLTGAVPVKALDVTFILTNNVLDSAGSVNVTLRSDVGPKTVIADLGTINDNAIGSLTSVSLSVGNLLLSPNTQYWFFLTPSSSTLGWGYSLDSSGPGVAPQDYYWNGEVRPNVWGPNLMKVTATAVAPEPVSLFLLGTGLVGGVIVRRKRS